MSAQPFNQTSAREIVYFLIDYWKIFSLFGFLGIVSAFLYIWFTPPQYQAFGNIQLARISEGKNFHNVDLLESRSLVIARIKHPSFYLNDSVSLCGGVDEIFTTHGKSMKNIQIAEGKDPTLIELTVRGPSADGAYNCLNDIFVALKSSQKKYLSTYIVNARLKLKSNNENLRSGLFFLDDPIFSKDESMANYSKLAALEKIRYTVEENMRISTTIKGAEMLTTNLVNPIFVSSKTYNKNYGIILISGLLIGLSIGLLFIVSKNKYHVYKLYYQK